MREFLSPATYIDSDHPAVIAFSRKNAKGNTPLERAISLYYAVRDGIRYNPFLDYSNDAAFRASQCIASGEGFCVGKAALLAACARVDGVPARVGFADVKNHSARHRILVQAARDSQHLQRTVNHAPTVSRFVGGAMRTYERANSSWTVS
jgi:transglutaminase-like putative cysteine protease